MIKSTINLYRTELSYNKNWKFEDIEKYLDDPVFSVTGKYVDPSLDTTIIIKKKQEKISGLGANYCKITNEFDSTSYYYFITNIEWNARNSVRLTLKLDVLNTIGITEDRFTSQTRIIREHRDRWKKVGNKYYAIVDKYQEGLDVAKDILQHNTKMNGDNMYLIQMSRNATTPDTTDKHPYGTYICFDNSYTYDNDTGSSLVTDYFFEPDKTKLYHMLEGIIDNTGCRYEIGYTVYTKDGTTGVLREVTMYVNNGNCLYNCSYYTGDTYPYSFLYTESFQSTDSLRFHVLNVRNIYYENRTQYRIDNRDIDRIPSLDFYAVKKGTYSALKTTALSDIDRTNSSIMAIYVAPKVAFDNTNCTFIPGYNLLKPNNWKTNQGLTSGAIEISYLTNSTIPTVTTQRSKEFETKLYSNEIADIGIYYQGQCIFDFDASRYNQSDVPSLYSYLQVNEDNPQELKFNTMCSQYNFNSKYERYTFLNTKYSVPLYTNEWNEYVRNGYNYDVAERNRQKSLQGWNIALGVVGAGLSIGTTIASGGLTALSSYKSITSLGNQVASLASSRDTAMATANAIASNPSNIRKNGDLRSNASASYADWMSKSENYADQYATALHNYNDMKSNLKSGANQLTGLVLNQGVGSVNSAINAYYAISGANMSYQHNIQTRANSHTAITGSNSNYITAVDNIVELDCWQPESYILENIAKVFHLTGYSHPVQEVPELNTRYWFNYIQCDAVWDDDMLNNNNPTWLQELYNKFLQGVTYFHYHNEYDTEQWYENMEVSLING